MKISLFKLSLLCLCLGIFASCNSVEELSPIEDGIIQESMLEPLDFAISAQEEEEMYTLMNTEEDSCKFLGRIRMVREGDEGCNYLIQLRKRRFISPVNIDDIAEVLENGKFVQVGLERAEEKVCERGTPAYVTCIIGFEFEKEHVARRTINSWKRRSQ